MRFLTASNTLFQATFMLKPSPSSFPTKSKSEYFFSGQKRPWSYRCIEKYKTLNITKWHMVVTLRLVQQKWEMSLHNLYLYSVFVQPALTFRHGWINKTTKYFIIPSTTQKKVILLFDTVTETAVLLLVMKHLLHDQRRTEWGGGEIGVCDPN